MSKLELNNCHILLHIGLLKKKLGKILKLWRYHASNMLIRGLKVRELYATQDDLAINFYTILYFVLESKIIYILDKCLR